MKKRTVVVLLMALSCSRTERADKREAAKSSPPSAAAVAPKPNTASESAAKELTVATNGDPFGLRFEKGMLAFCDKRGPRRLDLDTGRESALDKSCPSSDEPNVACSELNLNIAVRAPLAESSDIVDFDGWSVALPGRVHDCAADGKVVAIVTGSSLVVIDTAKETTKEIRMEGGQRVAIDSAWVAWAKASELRVLPRQALK
ncbi:MAG TPA: hypothetical protein VKE51_41790 [Vicinamibacterales bacterium]|nr:hypothetical protein [Vicinamibacterales bacterium]